MIHISTTRTPSRVPKLAGYPWRLLMALLVVGSTLPLRAQTTYPIHYTLPVSGKVSLAIYDLTGKHVRTLLSTVNRSAGANAAEIWDGKDDKGNLVTNATACRWKLLAIPGVGLQADYLMTLGSTFPQGNSEWETSLGNHTGPRSVALDATGVYVGAGISENVTNALKMNVEGTQRIWSAGNSENSETKPFRLFQGRWSAGVSNEKYYFLQQNGYVAYHSVNTPNSRDATVGHDGGNNFYVGTRWDALWAGDNRDALDETWEQAGGQTMDMAVHNGVMVISYKDKNAIRFMNPDGGTVRDTITGVDGGGKSKRLFNGMNAIMLRQVSIPSPLGVALDNAGNAYVLSQGSVLKVTQASSVSTLITGLTSPFRLDVDKTTGDIFIAEQGLSQRIKRFSASGAFLQAYGAEGGRQYGLYNAANFKDVVDIVADGQGGFWAAEIGAPRRLVHRTGSGVLKEWLGGTHWVPTLSPDPADRSVVWMSVDAGELMQLKLDYGTKRWVVHSVYKFAGLGGGLVQAHFAGENAGLGGGYGDWHPRRHKRNNQDHLYLIRRGMLEVLKVDTTNWSLKAVVVGKFAKDANDRDTLWTDANGDGLPQPGEYRGFSSRNYGRFSLQAPVGFDYFCLGPYGPSILSHTVKAWKSVGAPVYAALDSSRQFGQGQLPIDFAESLYRGDYYYGGPGPPTGIFARESETAPLYMAFNSMIGRAPTQKDWGQAQYTKMYKLDAAGAFQWRVGQHQDRPNQGAHPSPAPGIIHTFKNTVGVVKGVVVATDYNGGWDGGWNPTGVEQDPVAITYAWDSTGLFVGGLFSNPNLALGPYWQYNHARDNGAGTMLTNPADPNEIIYFAGAENEGRVFSIKGWSNWTRLSGPVNNSASAYAINAGGPETNGFSADGYVTGGTVSRISTDAISLTGLTNPAPMAVYQTGRHGAMSYTFPGLDASKTYTVRLHLAETYWTAAGQRKFHVEANGVRRLSDLDVFAAAGGANKGLIREFTLQPISNGQVTLSFINVVDNAQIRGIQVLPLEGPTFYRAINLNGSTLSIDGKNWEASASAPNVSIEGNTYLYNTGQFTPAFSSANQESMLRSGYWHWQNLRVNVGGMPNGTYQVYLHVIEDNGTATYSVNLEGQTVVSNFTTQPNTWSKLGPYSVAVSDGTLNLTHQGGDLTLSGLEIWRVNSPARLSYEASIHEALALYPNPASQQLTVQLPLAKAEVQVEITDTWGRIIQANRLQPVGASREVSLSVVQLPAGLYLLRLQQAGHSFTRKVLITR